MCRLNETAVTVSAAILMVILSGCRNAGDVGAKGPEAGNGSDSVQRVELIPVPERKPLPRWDMVRLLNTLLGEDLGGKNFIRRWYGARLATVNLLGDGAAALFRPQRVWEHRLPKARRSLVVSDERTDTCLAIIYEDFREGTRSIDLSAEHSPNSGWLLRGMCANRKPDAELLTFLANPHHSAKAFRLEGKVEVTLEDDHMASLAIIGGLSTVELVPPDVPALRKLQALSRRQLDLSRKELADNPDGEVLKWGVEYIQRIDNIIKAEPKSPGRYSEGWMSAQWGDRPLDPFILSP